MIKNTAIFLMLLLSVNVVYSQEDSHCTSKIVELIKKQLSKPALQKLEKIEKEEQSSFSDLSEINKRYEELKQKKQETENQKDIKKENDC